MFLLLFRFIHTDQKSLFNINSDSAVAVAVVDGAVDVVVGVDVVVDVDVDVVAAAAAPNLADDVQHQHGNDRLQKHFSFFRRFEQQ